MTKFLLRWRSDLKALFKGISKDPFIQEESGRNWAREFSGDITSDDQKYAAFLVALSLIPAILVASISKRPQIEVLAQLFGAPVQAIIAGFLTSVLLFLGSHVNRAPKPYPVAFKLMLRVMAVHPVLSFLTLHKLGLPLGVLIYGFFVIRSVRKTYDIPLKNAVLFFGTTYFMFALLQLQATFTPPQPGKLKSYYDEPPVIEKEAQ